MKDIDMLLPSYPCTEDLWDRLAAETRPIVCYGMGNGADKLIARLDKYNVTIADFFASDGFVRGHSFHGKRVLSFSEIKEKYSDFIILLSFASNRKEVLDMLCDIDSKHEMLIPDMPVAGEEYFDREFFNDHYNEIMSAYDSLCDDKSKATFATVIKYKLTGSMKYLSETATREELYSLFEKENIKTVIDAGAYNGDTLREAKTYFSNLRSAVAIEPDTRNYKKLLRYIEAENDISIEAYNAAAWSENTVGSFFSSGNRNSTASATASFEHKESDVSLVTIDSISPSNVDYIKYDVEGAELPALVGSEETIRRTKPALLVSAYHRSCDIFYLTNYLRETYPIYKIYLRRLWCVPAWELDIILIPEEQ